MRFHIHKPLRSVVRGSLLAAVFSHAGLFLLVSPFAISLRFWTPSVHAYSVYRLLRGEAAISPIQPVRLEDLPSYVPRMFVTLEDGRFFEHHGVDPVAIRRAMDLNRARGANVFGGSTITQQLARTLLLTPHRHMFRKYLEALIALNLEVFLSKERILELYINTIEMGPGIFGLQAAARHHYRKDAVDLSFDEFARIAAIITNPRLFTVRDLSRWRGPSNRYAMLISRFR